MRATHAKIVVCGVSAFDLACLHDSHQLFITVRVHVCVGCMQKSHQHNTKHTPTLSSKIQRTLSKGHHCNEVIASCTM